MIKLVATDIDGTILKEDRVFTSGVINCIKELGDNGIKVVLVTGRMHAGAKKIAARLDLKTPIVSFQGGLVRDNDDNTLYERFLPEDVVDQIIEWSRKNKAHINLYTNDTLYSENDNEIIKRYAHCQELDYTIKNFDEIEHTRINKLLGIDYNNADRVTDWVNTMTEKYPNLHIVKSTPYFCEFSSLDATKACAVEFLQQYWGIKKSETLTIGDQNNDIELLKAGGIKIAMGNATEDLKKIADYITDSVDNDGFVKAIHKFVFNGEGK